MAPFFKETAARQRFWKYSTAGLRYVAAAKDRLGLTRRRRPFVDYGKYQHWPFYLHPFLDLRHMQFRRYVEDLYDAATFSPKKPNVPVLILVSREDPLIDIPRLSRAVSSWDAKIVFFPPTGEVAHLVREKQRNFIVKQINDWHALHHYSG
jgi:pimeloyl-ACP methyl ester carboxylesterase